ARIQAALDQVASFPVDPDTGYRGVVRLNAGEYRIRDHVEIRASGVILRGAGRSTQGTVLRAVGTARREEGLVQIKGSGSLRPVPGSERQIIDAYVPVGARTFHVASADGLSVNDHIIVHRPSTAEWIEEIRMSRTYYPTGEVWVPGTKDLNSDRVITQI